jgi:hypothetical protein
VQFNKRTDAERIEIPESGKRSGGDERTVAGRVALGGQNSDFSVRQPNEINKRFLESKCCEASQL